MEEDFESLPALVRYDTLVQKVKDAEEGASWLVTKETVAVAVLIGYSEWQALRSEIERLSGKEIV